MCICGQAPIVTFCSVPCSCLHACNFLLSVALLRPVVLLKEVHAPADAGLLQMHVLLAREERPTVHMRPHHMGRECILLADTTLLRHVTETETISWEVLAGCRCACC